MKEITEIIGLRIKEAREQANRTQKQLALVLGHKTPNAISEIERGNVNISAKDLYNLAIYLDKPLMYFFGKDYDDAEVVALVEQMPQSNLDELRDLVGASIELNEIQAIVQSSEELSEDDQIRYAEALWEMLHRQLKNTGRKMRDAFQAREQLEDFLKINIDNSNSKTDSAG